VSSRFNISVANTVLILSTGPVFAALLGWLLLRERVSRATWFAKVLAFLGVAIMVSGGIAAGDQLGMLFAFVAVFAFAVMIVALRRAPACKDMLLGGALVLCAVAFQGLSGLRKN